MRNDYIYLVNSHGERDAEPRPKVRLNLCDHLYWLIQRVTGRQQVEQSREEYNLVGNNIYWNSTLMRNDKVENSSESST